MGYLCKRQRGGRSIEAFFGTLVCSISSALLFDFNSHRSGCGLSIDNTLQGRTHSRELGQHKFRDKKVGFGFYLRCDSTLPVLAHGVQHPEDTPEIRKAGPGRCA